MELDKQIKSCLKVLEERMPQYSKCELTFSIVKVNGVNKIYNGVIVFFNEKDRIPDKVRLVYKDFILDRQIIDATEGKKTIDKLLTENKITLYEFGEFELEANEIFTPYGDYLSAYKPYGFAYNKFEWPRRWIGYNIKISPTTSFNNSEIVSVQNPLYPSARYAIANFMNGNYSDTPPIPRIEIIIPDYRARIRKACMLDQKVKFEVEERYTTESNIKFKYFMQTSSEIKSGEAQINENAASVEYPENVTFLMTVILDVSKNEVIDSKYMYPFTQELWQERTDQSYKSLINNALSGKENKNLELKEKLNNKVYKTATAFANTGGGTIIIGITDKSREIVGCLDSEDTITQSIASNTEPPVEFTIKDITYTEKHLKVIEIPEGANKPYIAKQNGIFIRRNGISEQITRVELDDIIQKRRTSQWQPLM